ncbi:carbonic anhydrase [Xanthomonadaceae bacterium JHOS43]|nr:carbonic anhydrase [Xanthomonadaceae bacterium JHOS43]MCX7562186.1 carbonic anhydrase [Xanthomonadaceae bacterium XH05]
MIPADQALARLREGNQRFVESLAKEDAMVSRRLSLCQDQKPFAIILGCSDARVPAELVFDQGLGDLFVIRVAGNIVAPSQVGSVEFATERFGVRLVVVLGHTQCGAISATIEQLLKPVETQSRNLQSIVDRVRPSIEGLLHTELRNDPKTLALHGMRANIGVSVSHLRHGSVVLEKLIREDGLRIVGAEYSVQTGAVTFLDGSCPVD